MTATRAESIWLSEVSQDEQRIVYRDSLPIEAEILIIGGGFTGIAVAYHLSEVHGKNSLVLEGRQLCGSATGRNAGMNWPNQKEVFEVKTAEKVAEFIKNHPFLTEEDALVNSAGGVRLVKKSNEENTSAVDILPGLNPSLGYEAYKDASVSFFPARVARALATSSEKAEFMESVQVLGVEKTQKDRHLIRTSKGDLHARKVVVCTNSEIPALLPELSSIVKPVTNTVLASKPVDPKLLPKVSGISEGAGSAEVYMNIRADSRLILGGLRCIVEAEETSSWKEELERKTGKVPVDDVGSGDPRIVSALKQWLSTHFPSIAAVVEWEYSWKGLIAVNVKDGMPLAGPLPSEDRRGIFVCGVLGGHGMPRCLGLGAAVANMLMGVPESDEYSKDFMYRCRVDRFEV